VTTAFLMGEALAVPYQRLVQKLVGVDKPAEVVTGLVA